MYESTKNSLCDWSLSSATASTISSNLLVIPYLSLSAITLTASHGGAGTALNAITGLYGCYYNNFYDNVYFATSAARQFTASNANYGKLFYFKWTSLIYDDVADAVSGVALYSHPEQNKIFGATVTGKVNFSQPYITITAHLWNIDDTNNSMFDYDMSNSDASLYIYDNNKHIFLYGPTTMNHSFETPKGTFNSYGYFWKTINTSELNDGGKYLYWIKTTNTWTGKTSYSMTGSITASTTSPAWEFSGTAATGDFTGFTRGDSLTSGHSSIAICAKSGSSYYWKDIFRKTWTL